VSARYLPKVGRRVALQWLAAASMTSTLPWYTRADGTTIAAFQPTANGFGTDPDLNHPVIPWRRIMEPHQLQQTAVLGDLILPDSTTAPAPSALGIPDFVDEWVSAPYPEQLEDRKTILEGLRWMDAEASRRWQRSFLEIDEQSRQRVVAEIAQTRIDSSLSRRASSFSDFAFSLWALITRLRKDFAISAMSAMCPWKPIHP
jgi:Gluconate 2-dehydrogenase subunit 3